MQKSMDISIYLGRFFGLYLLITGVLLIVRCHSFRVVIHDFFKSPALLTLSGVVGVVLGLLFVLAHNVWEWNWSLIVTLLAYLTLIRGILHLYIPEWAQKVSHHFDNVRTLRISGFVIAILGIFLIVCTFQA